jgi:hypothetical protein
MVLAERGRSGLRVIALLFAGMVLVEALAPFHFLSAPRPFGWIPFRGFFHGSLSVNLVSFLEKCFVYGALVWLLARSGVRLGIAAAGAAAFVLALHVAQTYLPGRSAEITDPLLVLLLAGAMAVLEGPGNVKPVSARRTG